MSVAATWGTTEEERSLSFPCDRYLENSNAAYYRGVTIKAPAALIFRWLCQLRAAPYSYDWIDNFGRKSPRTLTPGLDELAVGQKVMRAELVDFEKDRQATALVSSRLWGSMAVTYLIIPQGLNNCRLLVKLLVLFPKGPMGWLLRVVLPWGDLVMMRRQLLNFKCLAERSARHGARMPHA